MPWHGVMDDLGRPLFDDILDRVREEVGDDTSGHEAEHARRVFRLATAIADGEGADRTVVGAAALTHDIHRTMGGEGFVDPAESLPVVEGILEDAGFPADKREAVCHCVAVHEEYGFEGAPSAAETLEARVVQDADNLDAMGAIGVGRTFRFSGDRGTPMWRPDSEPREEYDKTDLSRSVIDHFEDKLLRLRDDMNTETARTIAADRHEFMVAFVERFRREWRCEDL